MDEISREPMGDGSSTSTQVPKNARKGPDDAIDAAFGREALDRVSGDGGPSGTEPDRPNVRSSDDAELAATNGVEAGAPNPEAELGDDARPLSDPGEVSRVAMAVLLATREPMSSLRLAQACNSSQKVVAEALEQLEADLRESGMPLEVCFAGDSVKLMTLPDVYPYLQRLRASKKVERLSPAALETLAVVAYRQPVIRAEIEAIRGVKVGPTLRTLLDHKMVGVVGRKDVPGRPLQYGTTQTFLERFGIKSLADLPSVREFKSLG